MINRRNLFQSIGLGLFASPLMASAYQTHNLSETFSPGNRFRITSRTELSGTMQLISSPNSTKQLLIKGSSQIEFDETILALDSSFKVQKSIRDYRKAELNRNLDGDAQQSTLRPELRKIVILRKDSKKIPFSKEGLLTWDELDLIRTDVFPCALLGLLPSRSVSLNENWIAAKDSIQELTDLDVLQSTEVSCKLDSVNLVNNRRTARISFLGKVAGLNEDGPNQQFLDGYLFFDCELRHLSFLYLKGTSILKNKEGKEVGKMEGRYTLTSEVLPAVSLDNKVVGQYEPESADLKLLLENNRTLFAFSYPREWKVASQSLMQATLDYSNQAGLLITRDNTRRYAFSNTYLKETSEFLQKQQAKIESHQPIQNVFGVIGLESFSWDVQIAGQRVHLLYFVYKKGDAVFTLACRIPLDNKVMLRNDIVSIASSLRIVQKNG